MKSNGDISSPLSPELRRFQVYASLFTVSIQTQYSASSLIVGTRVAGAATLPALSRHDGLRHLFVEQCLKLSLPLAISLNWGDSRENLHSLSFRFTIISHLTWNSFICWFIYDDITQNESILRAPACCRDTHIDTGISRYTYGSVSSKQAAGEQWQARPPWTACVSKSYEKTSVFHHRDTAIASLITFFPCYDS